MKQFSVKIIDLPRSHYKILNSPPPPRSWVLAALAVIMVMALVWAIL